MTSKAPALIDWLVNAFTAAPTLGQATPGLSAGDLLQNNTAQGAFARIPFVVSFTSFT